MKDQAVLRSIPLGAIRPSPFQYRTRFDDENQRALVESMRIDGQSTPILLRPLPDDGVFEIVSGERRCRAGNELGWKSMQAIVEEMTDAEAAARVVTENEVRSDVNIMERAAGYKRLTQPPCNFTLEEIARRYGLGSASSVKRIIDLLDEPDTIRDLLSRDRLTEGHVRYLTRIKDKRARVILAKQAAAEGWSVKMTEQRVARKLGNAPKAAGNSNGKTGKRGAIYEYRYNNFNCALIGDQVELSGRRFKMNEESIDQYLGDQRVALESFVRDVRERLAAQRAPQSSGELVSSIQPSPSAPSTTAPASPPADVQKTSAEIEAERQELAANFHAAGQDIKNILAEIAKPSGPTTPEPSGVGTPPVEPHK